ncbi:MAG: hypothetical protein JSS35_14745, partial [Proteobacteria bacterium]|nr:hypothetical protein [Pseudomonadota bacterium]
MSDVSVKPSNDFAKGAFFTFLGACTLAVIWADERFLLASSDPEWTHIAAFKWLLLPHGL